MKQLKLDEKLLSGPNVAKTWDLDPATVRRWRREGAPYHILGNGLIRYRRSELEKWRGSRPVHHIVALGGKNQKRFAGVKSTTRRRQGTSYEQSKIEDGLDVRHIAIIPSKSPDAGSRRLGVTPAQEA
jgi:hypothetical protein